MPAYLFVFEAQPTRAAVPTEDIAGAMVHVWVVWKSLDEAERHAREFVRDCDWVIDAVTHRLQPTDAQIARLEDSELGNYNRALRAGISADFIAWPKRASRTMSSPVVRPVSADWKKRREAEYWSFESARRRRFAVKYCLHPSARSHDCAGQIVKAHSVQKNGSLARMAKDGHIYRISTDARTLRHTSGMPAVELVGLKHASTFTGLCARHDNTTFAPVEKHHFHGDREQCFLLAYRAVLREVYVKRAALETAPALATFIDTKPDVTRTRLKRLTSIFFESTKLGLHALEQHKSLLDQMLALRDFGDIRFAIIWFRKVPDLMMSSVWCPTSDFDGNVLSNIDCLGQDGVIPDLLTFSLLGTATGGAGVFVWRASSDSSCNQIVASLVGRDHGSFTDALVRLAFQTSENIYLSPKWWDGLAAGDQAALMSRMATGLNLLEPFKSSDLIDDGLRFASWEPTSVTLRVTATGGVLETTESYIGMGANGGAGGATSLRA
jgi:hypothetical protein